ncbi:aminoacetone oxidase family FAD-binding enzyme [Candidatus Peregrinibacteria bacterium]|nr:aminoacetone oxidase family FAD-binding enzyme [Candidatus Peregrinibacteria bacterium]
MKIAVIGAGAAGIFSAIFLRNFKAEIHIFEQNEILGEKLRLTGGGRMNITNKRLSAADYFSSEERLKNNLLKTRWLDRREELFDELGIKYKWEENRAIAKTENAVREVERLIRAIKKQRNAFIREKIKISDIQKSGNKYLLKFDNKTEEFEFVIIATGGMLKLHDMGGREDIYKLPIKLGHTITKTRPVLTPLVITNNPFKQIAGLSFKGVIKNIGSKEEFNGDILITHLGISGPAVLDFSSVFEGSSCELGFISGLNENQFKDEFWKLREGKNYVRTFLHKFMPKSLYEWHLKKCGISTESTIADVNKEKFNNLLSNLYRLVLSGVQRMDYSNAWTTQGGVDLKEINVATMESKLNPHIFFAGEVVDMNGLCGGYNITFAAITAKIAAEAILNYSK